MLAFSNQLRSSRQLTDVSDPRLQGGREAHAAGREHALRLLDRFLVCVVLAHCSDELTPQPFV